MHYGELENRELSELHVLMKLLLCHTDSANSTDTRTERKTDEHTERQGGRQ